MGKLSRCFVTTVPMLCDGCPNEWLKVDFSTTKTEVVVFVIDYTELTRGYAMNFLVSLQVP